MKLNLMTETRATRINVKDRVVEAESRNGGSKLLKYDGLVIAMGAIPRRSTIEGSDKDGVFALYTLTNGMEKAKAMRHSHSACVIGAGYIGLEIAEALIEKGLRTSVIGSRETVLPNIIDPNLSLILQEYLER
jgi:NADPH-dependent 2,4-dienoyl-CoA reductase/sulfur reductase-like enzyme